MGSQVGIPAQDLGVAEDAVERGAQLVAHVGQELALRLARLFGVLLGLAQLGLDLKAGLLDLVPEGDVDHRPLVIKNLPLGIADRPRVLRDPDVAAVAVMDLGDEIVDHVILVQEGAKLIAAPGVDIEAHLDIPDAFDQLVHGGEAVDAGQGEVGGEIASLGRGLEHPLHRVLEDIAEAGLALLAPRLLLPRPGALVLGLEIFAAQPLGDLVEGLDHSAQFVAGLDADRSLVFAPGHPFGRMANAEHGPHHPEIEGREERPSQQQQASRHHQGQSAPLLESPDAGAQQPVEAVGGLVPELLAGDHGAAAFRIDLGGGGHHLLRSQELMAAIGVVVFQGAEVVRQGGTKLLFHDMRPVAGDGDLHPFFEVGAEGLEHRQLLGQRSLLRGRDLPRPGELAAKEARAGQQLLNAGPFHDRRIHQVIGREVGIENQVRAVADVGEEGSPVGGEIGQERLGLGDPGGLDAVMERIPILGQDVVEMPGIQALPEVPLDRLHRIEAALISSSFRIKAGRVSGWWANAAAALSASPFRTMNSCRGRR